MHSLSIPGRSYRALPPVQLVMHAVMGYVSLVTVANCISDVIPMHTAVLWRPHSLHRTAVALASPCHSLTVANHVPDVLREPCACNLPVYL